MVMIDFVKNESHCSDFLFYGRLKIDYTFLMFYSKRSVSVHCQTKTVDQSNCNLDRMAFSDATDVRSGLPL